MIKKSTLVLLLAFVASLSGCATPQQAYVNQHPELSAEHRKIIAAGRLVDHAPVAGMTREQIRLTMGVDPTQVTSINGEDAWVWVKKRGDSLTLMDESDHGGSPGAGSFSGLPRDSEPETKKPMIIRTTVFFHGNLATRVDVTAQALSL